MRTIELAGGHTATLREKSDLKVKHRQLIEAAALAAGPAIDRIPRKKTDAGTEIDWERLSEAHFTRQESQAFLELGNASILAMLEAWTLPEPLPRTLDDIDEMSADVYDELAQAVKSDAATIATETSFEPSDPRAPGFSETPTLPSGD